jgi:hypothetical protein
MLLAVDFATKENSNKSDLLRLISEGNLFFPGLVHAK